MTDTKEALERAFDNAGHLQSKYADRLERVQVMLEAMMEAGAVTAEARAIAEQLGLSLEPLDLDARDLVLTAAGDVWKVRARSINVHAGELENGSRRITIELVGYRQPGENRHARKMEREQLGEWVGMGEPR